MGFWGNFFKGFGRTVVSSLSTEALDEAVRATKAEIDGLDGALDEEKAGMKMGVDLLRQRVDAFVGKSLGA